MARTALVSTLLAIALVACTAGNEQEESVGRDASGTSAPAGRETSLPATSIDHSEPPLDPSTLDDLYQECLSAMAFDPAGAQVLIDETGKPWWVKTGLDVPPDLHGPCLAEIGGEPNGLSSWGDFGRPPEECVALVGGEPWITLFSPELNHRCVLVAEHQNIQIWNKGFDSPLTIEWLDGPRGLRSDEYFETGPLGLLVAAGPTQIESSPYPMPTIWLVPAHASPSAGLVSGDGSFGPVTVGMTMGEASDLLGLSIQIDVNLLPGPSCLGAVIVDDPYSPVFVIALDDHEASSIILSIDEELTEDPCR